MKQILFNTEMVRAILEGRKTVTRRAVKLKYSNTHIEWMNTKYGKKLIEMQNNVKGETYGRNPDGSTWHRLLAYRELKAPYAKGDIIYVKETWNRGFFESSDVEGDNSQWFEEYHKMDGGFCDAISHYIYRADFTPEEEFEYGVEVKSGIFKMPWKPSIHMPKEAARIWLKVIDVRVERLNNITTEEALKEGCTGEQCNHVNQGAFGCTDCYNTGWLYPPEAEFRELWNSTIKKQDTNQYGRDANPFVWVIEFERCEKPEENCL